MANITMRLHKDGSRAYTIRIYRGVDPRTGKQLKPYTKTWIAPLGWSDERADRSAKKQAALFENECQSGLCADGRITFYDYGSYVIKLKETGGTKHKTILNYNRSLMVLHPYIGHIKICDLTARHLNDSYMKLSSTPSQKNPNKTLSSKTVLEYHRFISSVLSTAVKEGIVRENVAARATPPVYKRKTPNYYQPDTVVEISKALEEAPLKWRLMTHLLLITGARRGEVAGLEWSRINLDSCMIDISVSLLYAPDIGIYKDTTKEDNPHWVKVPKETISLLHEYRSLWLQQKLKCGDKWHESDYVFVQWNGLPMHPDSLNTWMCRFSNEHGLPHLNPHAFRHTHASILYHGGIDGVTVSHRLGHKQLSTTQNIYAHIIQGAEEAASNCVASAVFCNPSAGVDQNTKNNFAI